MAVHEFPFTPTPAERSAWRKLVGLGTDVPDNKAAMRDIAKEVYNRRIAQAGADIGALCELTEAAETLDVFNGPIDTQSTTLFGKKPNSLPKDFTPIEAVKTWGESGPERGPAGNDTQNEQRG